MTERDELIAQWLESGAPEAFTNVSEKDMRIALAYFSEAEGKQEPVAALVEVRRTNGPWQRYNVYDSVALAEDTQKRTNGGAIEVRVVPLYAAPVAQKPLTRKQLLEAFYAETACTLGGDVDFAEKVCRVVERAHGIGGGK